MQKDKYAIHKEKFLNGELKQAKIFFAKNGYTLEHAYCKLIEEDLKGAKQLFLKTKDHDNRALWGYKIVSILQNKSRDKEIFYDDMPTFFQLRNFLELDLSILLTYHKGNYVETLCMYSDIFQDINSESYKYFARAFHFNNYREFAEYFAQKAKNSFYNDAELHYHIALMFYQKGNFEVAKNHCLSCLHILNGYHPAQKMLNELTLKFG